MELNITSGPVARKKQYDGLDQKQKEFLEGLSSELENDILLWGHLFVPEYFRRPSPSFHEVLISAASNARRLAVAAPRESSKSTLLTFLYPLHSMLYKKKRHIILILSNFTKATSALRGIKDAISKNESVRKQYRIKTPKDSEGDTIFRHPDGLECRIVCFGREQLPKVRGERFGPYRPDLVIIDDLEDDELVKSKERRIELQSHFDNAVIPALDFKDSQLIVIGTVLHLDSLLYKLVCRSQYQDFKKLFFQALSSKGTSLWPEKWSVDDLKKIEAINPVMFAREYQNKPIEGNTQIFRRDDFRTWRIEEGNYVLLDKEGFVSSRGSLRDCKAAIACDLAWEEKRESDNSVILSAYLTPNAEILVESYICKKGMRPHEVEEALFSMEQRLRLTTGSSVPIGFEKSKLEKVTKWLMQRAMKQRNHYLVFKDLAWDGDKIERIITRLEARYNQHSIYHRSGMGSLELELLSFPSGSHDDLCDSLQGVCQLLMNPKSPKKITQAEDKFMRLRQFAIDCRNGRADKYKIKGKNRIPANISIFS